MTTTEENPIDSLEDWEHEMIEFFLLAADAFNLPRSVGQIFGLCFVAQQPLSLNDIVERLKISKGSASQGLRFLRNIGAIKPVHRTGDRRDVFQPELELRVVLSGLLRERALPYLDQGNRRLAELNQLNPSSPEARKHFLNRLAKLKAWHSQAGTLLPLLSRFIG
ncbi:MAG: hypothetical protein SynsKO_13050 [Synoicihabitans sp.]